MTTFFVGVAVFIALLVLVNGYRVIVGPTFYDRMVGVGLCGTNTLLLLLLIGYFYERIDMFVDLAITYAMLNFIGVITIGKYLESRKELPS